MKKIQFEHEFSSDAGGIGVIDEEYLKENGGSLRDEYLNKKMVVAPGKYKINFYCKDSWLKNNIQKECKIETDGNLIFGDICYLFDNSPSGDQSWINFMKRTDYMEKHNKKFFFVNTGGDGSFIFNIMIKRKLLNLL